MVRMWQMEAGEVDGDAVMDGVGVAVCAAAKAVSTTNVIVRRVPPRLGGARGI